MNRHCKIVIPARLASTRLPEKLLRTAGGKSVLAHTYHAACQSEIASEVIIAVDDPRMAEEADRIGARWVMTRQDCPSGTDRLAEVAIALPEADIFVNVQGDEPEIDPKVIDAVATLLIEDQDADMATAGAPIRQRESLTDPSCVKIVLAAEAPERRRDLPSRCGRAIYFSRSNVPHCRDGIDEATLQAEPPAFWHHIGIYAYRQQFLQWFRQQPQGRLEQLEKLEQLRAVEAGKRILVAHVEKATPGIDTQADLDAFLQRLERS